MTFACPGAIVSGVVIPLVCTALAVAVICEIVTLVLPLLVKVTLLELELPTLTPPKATCTGVAVSVNDAKTPVPLKATFAGELGALLVIVTVPPRFPAVVGANSAINDALCPAASVAGVVSPLTLYPAPLTTNPWMVSDADPLLVMLNTCDFVWPLTRLPKLNVVGDTFSPACAPLPVTAIERGELFASLVTVIVPEEFAAEAGAKPTVRVAL